MQEILSRLLPEARILDLGSGPNGSFPEQECSGATVRCDLRWQSTTGDRFVCADARALPFAARSFDAVILNHSLEHFVDPRAALDEIGRVVRPSGWLWVAVPDASTPTDRLYRWVSRGGGHVNRFSDIGALVRLIEERTSLPHAGTRLLFSSFVYMNRHNGSLGFGRRMYLFGGGAEWALRIGTLLLRKADSWIGTRSSVYGWGCCFGPQVDFDTRPWSNVCVRCGSGYSSNWLIAAGQVRSGLLRPRCFYCPRCRARNYFTDDPHAVGGGRLFGECRT